MTKSITTACLLLVMLTLISGVIYPSVVTLIGQALFHYQANGSLIKHGDKIIGSLLIGQYVNNPRYFYGRISETATFPYNPLNSAASNFNIAEPKFKEILNIRDTKLRDQIYQPNLPTPIEIITASASGLDPEVSLKAIIYQVPRIAKLRMVPEKQLYALVAKHAIPRTFAILGEERVNVLTLNIALDAL